MKMSKEATKEYVLRMRERYGKMVAKRAKGRILDDFCATTGLERKHAIKVLRATGEPLRRSGRKRNYQEGVVKALEGIWLAAGQPCSKLMQPIMDCYVRSYEKQHGCFDRPVRQQLLKISPSSIDRVLRPTRHTSIRRRRSPAGLAAVKQEIPIRAGEWHVSEPGWIEADTVAHCGGNMGGSFVWSLTMTDILTQWTEIRVTWCRGAAATFGRIQEIEERLPFPVLGFDSDNGPEFMNWNLLSYFRNKDPKMEITRSRAYHKNDNAHVEQKNGTHVRGLLGHDRIEDRDCVDSLNEAMSLWSIWKNLYSPTMRLIHKIRKGKRYIKTYDRPQTPAQRVLTCETIKADQKSRIRALLASTDCFTLKRLVDNQLQTIFAAIRKRQKEQDCVLPGSGTSAPWAVPSGSVPPPGNTHRLTTKLAVSMVS